MTDKVNGTVEGVNTNFNGGLLIAGKWYNGIKDKTDTFVKDVKKGDTVEITIDAKNKIELLQVKNPNMPQNKTAPNTQINKKMSNEEYTAKVDKIVHDGGAIMSLCKNKTDQIFGVDAKYKDSMGTHCNSLFILATQKMKDEKL